VRPEIFTVARLDLCHGVSIDGDINHGDDLARVLQAGYVVRGRPEAGQASRRLLPPLAPESYFFVVR
jgi:hypothetical protein